MRESSACKHSWQQNSSSVCPYGHAFLEVTWPTGGSFFLKLCACFGYLPFIVFALCAVELFWRRGTRELNFVAFMSFVVLLNETVVKRIVNQPRPELSCVETCGMPSGHSVLAMGLLTMCLIDTVRRTVYQPNGGVMMRTLRQNRGVWRTIPSFLWSETLLVFSVVPLPTWDEISHVTALFISIFWLFLLYPVPISRVAIHDHTPKQALMGSIEGFVLACLWYYCVHVLQHRYNHLLGKPLIVFRGYKLLVHNFALPRFTAEQRVSCVPMRSKDADSELKWYQDQTNERVHSLNVLLMGGSDANHRVRRLNEEAIYLTQRQLRLQELRSTLAPQEDPP